MAIERIGGVFGDGERVSVICRGGFDQLTYGNDFDGSADRPDVGPSSDSVPPRLEILPAGGVRKPLG